MSSEIPPSIGIQGGGQQIGPPPPPGGGGGPAKQEADATKIKKPKSFDDNFITLKIITML
jgi:hypothetical protein